jgi:tripartite-type tricarboxylate transporter receptor subunit TctC
MGSLTRRIFASSAAATWLLGVRDGGAVRAQASYPTRPITIIVPWAAGGATDAVTRTIAASLERDLGQPVNVVNRTGGVGVVGHSAILNAAPDGYTLGMITIEVAMMHWQGISDIKPEDFTALALMSEDPPGVIVRADSEYKSVKELAEAIRTSPPTKFKASGAAQGSVWHLALVGWLRAMGLDPSHVVWVPSNGGAPALQELVAGGVDIVTCSVPEGRAMFDAGRARALAVMARARNPQFRDVPTLKEALDVDFTVGSWRGIGAPKGLPSLVVEKLTTALKKVRDSKEFTDYMESRGFALVWADAAGFSARMKDTEVMMGNLLKEAGLAKK